MDEMQLQPWYRQFWPWFVMVPPGVSVVAGLLTFFLAGTEPAMVVDDYGRVAMATERREERARHAAELGLVARLTFSPVSGANVQQAFVSLEQHGGVSKWPESLMLQLVHPTLSSRDQSIKLTGTAGRYSGWLERPAGRYYISINDDQATWRLTGELQAGLTALELDARDKLNDKLN